MAIPACFFGSWTLDKNENFDEYTAAKEVPWLLRKAISIAGHNISFSDLDHGKYRGEQSVMGKSVKYEFELNKQFELLNMDGTRRRVTVTVEDGNLVEWHTLIDKPHLPVDRQAYAVEGGRLVQSLKHADVSCKRYFKRKI